MLTLSARRSSRVVVAVLVVLAVAAVVVAVVLVLVVLPLCAHFTPESAGSPNNYA